MKFFITVIAVLCLHTLAFAHVTPGTYTGTKADGSNCSMTAQETYFENNKKHPLNERIKMTVDGVEFTVGHPAVVDASQSLASFNHDLFQGVLATSSGAQALVVEMVHEEGSEGPASFTFIENKWKSGEKISYKCKGIRLVE